LKSAGNYEAYTVPGVYFMSPEQPNCIVGVWIKRGQQS